MLQMCVDDQRNSKTGTHREWTKTHQRRVERHREGGSGAKPREGRARPSGREVTKRTKSNLEEAQMEVPTASKTTTNSSSGSHDTSLKFKQYRWNGENGQPCSPV